MEKEKNIVYLTIVFLIVLTGYGTAFSGTKFAIYGPSPVSTSSYGINGISKAKVTRVIDGDTIEIDGGVKVRLIGVDTPEIGTSGPKSCFGNEAKAETVKLLNDKEITLTKDVSETDRYGRLLRYVYLDGELVNNLLLKEGYARVATFPPDVKFQKIFLNSQEYARTHNLGLWKTCSG